jgi:hypothetical protein
MGWWIASGMRYFYPGPVYPYPGPYTPPLTIIKISNPRVVVPKSNVPIPPQQTAQPGMTVIKQRVITHMRQVVLRERRPFLLNLLSQDRVKVAIRSSHQYLVLNLSVYACWCSQYRANHTPDNYMIL